MELVTTRLERIFQKAIGDIAPDCGATALIQFTKDAALGDLQCNSAMALARQLGKNPVEIARLIIGKVDKQDIIASMDIAGPGFINISLAQGAVFDFIKAQHTGNIVFNRGSEGPVIIDYSAPNIAKRMHIGHLRSTILGDSLKRIYRHLGYEVIGDNHIGDWGTQFGKLITGYRKWLDKAAYAMNPIEELERIYVLFEQKSADEPGLLEEARHELKKLQDGDVENKALWQEFIDLSLNEYEKIYSRLGIVFDTHRGESFYHDLMPDIIRILTNKGLVQESDGALVVFFDEDEHLHPCIVQKQDGAYLYATSDLACMRRRMDEYNPHSIIYVTDDRQISHFRQIFSIADRLGWNVTREHIYFGVMKFTDGHFSSRKGNVIYLAHLLDESVNRAFEIVTQKNPSLSEAERREIARVVGTGAVKYFDLSQNRTSSIVFDWDRVLSFEGNTSPYLQYVYARIQSLTGKAEIKDIPVPETCPGITDSERRLLHSLLQYSNIVIQAAVSCRPNIIADYIYDLSQSFNSFYNSHPILKEQEETRNFRLFLCEQTAETIKSGLELLGIEVLARM